MAVSSNQFNNIFATPIVPTSPAPNGPGGNTIVPNPSTPSDWWKMLLAMGIGAGGIWAISVMGSEDAAKWTAVLVLIAIVTYYETHGNQKFSSGIQTLLGSIQ
jgi:hypothetical protein